MTVKSLNSIEAIYDGKEIFELKGVFICPVCKKEYKREKAAITHLAEQGCYNIKTLIRGTFHEELARKMYTSIMADIAPNARTGMMSFRKNKMFAPVARYVMFCSIYEVKQTELYFAWIRDVRGYKHANAVLSNGIKHETLGKYRLWLREHPEYIENDKFVSRYDDIINPDSEDYDPHFLIRSIEKSHVSIEYFLDYYGLTGQTIPTHNLEQESRVGHLMANIK